MRSSHRNRRGKNQSKPQAWTVETFRWKTPVHLVFIKELSWPRYSINIFQNVPQYISMWHLQIRRKPKPWHIPIRYQRSHKKNKTFFLPIHLSTYCCLATKIEVNGFSRFCTYLIRDFWVCSKVVQEAWNITLPGWLSWQVLYGEQVMERVWNISSEQAASCLGVWSALSKNGRTKFHYPQKKDWIFVLG